MTRNISKDLFQCVTDHRVNKPHSLYTESHSYLILHLVTFGQHLLDVSDRLGGVESLGTGLGAVHDRVAAVELEAVVQSLQSLLSLLVTRVDDPAVGLRERQSQTAIGGRRGGHLHEDGRAEVLVGVPPVRGAGGGAAGAENALVQPVQLLPVLLRLQELSVRQVVASLHLGLQPGLDRLVLGVEVGHVRHQVTEDVHLRHSDVT